MTFDLPPVATDLLLLAIRTVVAVAFVVSARNKFRNMKMFAKNNGLPVPAGYFVAIAESCGAFGLATGLLAQWAAAGLALLMIGTMSLHIFKWRSPYWASEGGWEYDLMLFCLSAAVFILGPGMFTLLG